MSNFDLEEKKKALKATIEASVANVFESSINAKIDEQYGDKEDKDEDKSDEDEDEDKVTESDDEDEDDSDEDDEDEDKVTESDDEDEDDSDDEDEAIEEAMKVEYLEKGAYSSENKGKIGNKVKTTSIKNHGELVTMAKSGKYEWFMVTKANGEEKEYHVDFEGKKPVLVEM